MRELRSATSATQIHWKCFSASLRLRASALKNLSIFNLKACIGKGELKVFNREAWSHSLVLFKLPHCSHIFSVISVPQWFFEVMVKI